MEKYPQWIKLFTGKDAGNMNTSRTEKNLQNASHFGRYACGTLNYTLRSLAAVFIWLMVGGMTLSVFTMLPGCMLPVKLQELGASDFQNSIILAVIGGTLNIIICPMVGFKSDRYRSRWGRRIPFILMSLPFISLSLILFGFGDRIGSWLAAATAGWVDIAPVTMTIVVIALVMFMFQFANMYVNSVFWYIFNDVIPAQFFGRVMGAFQVASNAGIAAFNFFVPHTAAVPKSQVPDNEIRTGKLNIQIRFLVLKISAVDFIHQIHTLVCGKFGVLRL